MYIEKKIIKGKPYYYLRQITHKNKKQVSDTVAYLGKNSLIAHFKFLLFKLKLIKI